MLVPCSNPLMLGFHDKPPLCVFPIESGTRENEKRGDFVVLGVIDKSTKDMVDEAKRVFGKYVFERKPLKDLKTAQVVEQRIPVFRPSPITRVLCMSIKDLRLPKTPAEQALLVRLKTTTKGAIKGGEDFRKPVDIVVDALGWVHDTSIYDKSMEIKMHGMPSRKIDSKVYPLLNSEYESVSAKHFFFAGAATHGMDRYKYKASGGFIHGFRFTARSLWRILEGRYEHEEHAISQPIFVDGTTKFPFDFGRLETEFDPERKVRDGEKLPALWAKLQSRINDAAGPYEMVGGSLSDGIIYDCAKKTAWYIEDVPEDLIHDRYSKHPRVTWSYHYGLFHNQIAEASICGIRSASAGIFSRFIHPVIQYFPPGKVINPKPLGHEPYVDQNTRHCYNAGNGHSDVKHCLFRYRQNEGLSDEHEHPSSFWVHFDGVKRVHIREAFIMTDWDDPDIIEHISLFMSNVEVAVAKFCEKRGDGKVEADFDERIDVLFHSEHPVLDTLVRNLTMECMQPESDLG
eukprot:gnl/MRDRNA2_/MRDRNA2_134085_c0_seq1.p1 gnl/MRDRNA2_/MRDRNA2_134085_c0~~gnl/MRDRNA2_/MRDRNA2_134085_c0_seq1.p1  ORF type:complete len:548 (-),score=68.35 gnl/MRDRNA2_/MRDRNA2_134085_c0_seq1:49-1593(-)